MNFGAFGPIQLTLHGSKGLILHLRRSKPDQQAEGQKIGIPRAPGRWCPVAALNGWLQVSGIAKGAIFRPLDRAGRVREARLSGDAVALIVRERVEESGLNPSGYFGHSLRAGVATSAAMIGVST